MKSFDWKDYALICLIFIIAFSVRYYHHSHLKEDILSYNLRSDSAEYYNGALNLLWHGTFSVSKPSNLPPQPDASRSPVYPIFLVPFIYLYQSLDNIWLNIIDFQALIGSFIAIISFVIARAVLTRPWALIVGLLTAFSPHLIASELFITTETLYTFVLILVNLLLYFSWKKRKITLIFISGLIVGISMLTRPVGLLLGPLFAVIFMIDHKKGELLSPKFWVTPVLIFYFGIILTFSPFLIRNYFSVGKFFPENKRGWESIVDGTYINFTYKNAFDGFPYKEDYENNRMKNDKNYFLKIMKDRFVSQPLPYLKWYLIGKIKSSWQWDISPNGSWDVYIYKLQKHGFYNYKILAFIYNFMKMLHRPLVWICFLTFPYLLFYYYKKKNIPDTYIKLLPPLIIIIYFNVLMIFVFSLPRYTIPLRPYCYLLAITNICSLVNYSFPKNVQLGKQ